MAGLTNEESVLTLDARFPVTGATDYIAWSENGTSESASLARTEIGATGWATAISADPAVKANANVLLTADATGAATISHMAVFSAVTGGTQRTDWKALTSGPQSVITGQKLSVPVGGVAVTLT